MEDISSIKKDVQEYVETRIDLVRLHTSENISRLLSSTAKLLIIGYLLFFILLFISFAVGFFLSEKLKSNELGFLCVAGIYIIILLVFVMLRRLIVERPIIKAIVRLFFPKLNDDEK